MVRPCDTDSRISAHSAPHVCWTPDGASRGLLIVFLPGLNHAPRARFAFASVASKLGYHIIALSYPNSFSAQKACENSHRVGAHLRFRRAVVEGGDTGMNRKIVPADAIENRLVKLLIYLAERSPSDQWGQFIGTHRQPRWNKIVIMGMSLGGGYAYVIGKIHDVAGVMMFGSPKDYSAYFKRPASGFDDQTRTPVNRFFVFNHWEDPTLGTHEQQRQLFTQMHLINLGVADADRQSTDYHHAHILYTHVDLPKELRHASVLADSTICRSVWRYLLTVLGSPR